MIFHNMDFRNDIKIKNKRASFEYVLLDKFTAGLVLLGTEIKSIRLGKAIINDAFISEIEGELYVRNMHIAEYESGTHGNHIPNRDRKLLLNKTEIKKILKQLRIKGLTAVPTLLFINDKGIAKLNFSLAEGKKLHDKRESLKQRDTERQLKRKQFD